MLAGLAFAGVMPVSALLAVAVRLALPRTSPFGTSEAGPGATVQP
jgi:hypothetical protein